MVAYNTTAVRGNSNVMSYAGIHTQNARRVTKIMSQNFQAVSSPIGTNTLVGLHTKISGAFRPLRDPILSFSHTFSPKSARVRGPRPP